MSKQIEQQADRMYNSIVRRIKTALLKRKMSYNKLAELAGISSSCISDIFNVYKTMNSITLIRLVIALGITQDLFNSKYTNQQIIDEEVKLREQLVEIKKEEIKQLQREIIDLTR